MSSIYRRFFFRFEKKTIITFVRNKYRVKFPVFPKFIFCLKYSFRGARIILKLSGLDLIC